MPPSVESIDSSPAPSPASASSASISPLSLLLEGRHFLRVLPSVDNSSSSPLCFSSCFLYFEPAAAANTKSNEKPQFGALQCIPANQMQQQQGDATQLTNSSSSAEWRIDCEKIKVIIAGKDSPLLQNRSAANLLPDRCFAIGIQSNSNNKENNNNNLIYYEFYSDSIAIRNSYLLGIRYIFTIKMKNKSLYKLQQRLEYIKSIHNYSMISTTNNIVESKENHNSLISINNNNNNNNKFHLLFNGIDLLFLSHGKSRKSSTRSMTPANMKFLPDSGKFGCFFYEISSTRTNNNSSSNKKISSNSSSSVRRGAVKSWFFLERIREIIFRQSNRNHNSSGENKENNNTNENENDNIAPIEYEICMEMENEGEIHLKSNNTNENSNNNYLNFLRWCMELKEIISILYKFDPTDIKGIPNLIGFQLIDQLLLVENSKNINNHDNNANSNSFVPHSQYPQYSFPSLNPFYESANYLSRGCKILSHSLSGTIPALFWLDLSGDRLGNFCLNFNENRDKSMNSELAKPNFQFLPVAGITDVYLGAQAEEFHHGKSAIEVIGDRCFTLTSKLSGSDQPISFHLEAADESTAATILDHIRSLFINAAMREPQNEEKYTVLHGEKQVAEQPKKIAAEPIAIAAVEIKPVITIEEPVVIPEEKSPQSIVVPVTPPAAIVGNSTPAQTPIPPALAVSIPVDSSSLGAHFQNYRYAAGSSGPIVSELIYLWFDSNAGDFGTLFWCLADSDRSCRRVVSADKQFEFHEISDVFLGRSTPELIEILPADFPNGRCFSLVAAAIGRSLNLVAESEEAREVYVTALKLAFQQAQEKVEADTDTDSKQLEPAQKPLESPVKLELTPTESPTAAVTTPLRASNPGFDSPSTPLRSPSNAIASVLSQPAVQSLLHGKLVSLYSLDAAGALSSRSLLLFYEKDESYYGSVFLSVPPPEVRTKEFKLSLHSISDIFLSRQKGAFKSAAIPDDCCLSLLSKSGQWDLQFRSGDERKEFIAATQLIFQSAGKKVIQSSSQAKSAKSPSAPLASPVTPAFTMADALAFFSSPIAIKIHHGEDGDEMCDLWIENDKVCWKGKLSKTLRQFAVQSIIGLYKGKSNEAGNAFSNSETAENRCGTIKSSEKSNSPIINFSTETAKRDQILQALKTIRTKKAANKEATQSNSCSSSNATAANEEGKYELLSPKSS